MTGLYETTEATMVKAHQAGMAYRRRNKAPGEPDLDALRMLARTCGWRGDDAVAWLAGYYGAQERDAA